MERPAGRYTPGCASIAVAIVGSRPAAVRLRDLLSRHAHPVRAVDAWGAAEHAVRRARVALLFEPLPSDLVACADRLRTGSPGLRIIALPEAMTAELEQQVMLREYVHLALAGPNVEALHTLVHAVLRVVPSPTPLALKS